MFILEYIYTSIESIKSYITNLDSSIKKMSFTLPQEQKVKATYGRLIELKKEDFFAVQYFFNEDLQNNLFSNLPLNNIYIIGLVSNSLLLGNITLIVHSPSIININVVEPIANSVSLLIQKRIEQNKLIENHKFYKCLLDTTKDFILVVNDENKICFSNQAFEEFLQKNNYNSNIINEDIESVLGFLNHKFFDKFLHVKKNKQSENFEVSTVINCTFYYFQIQITYNNFQEKFHYIIKIKDITAWVHSKKEVNYLTEVNKIFIENLNEGIILIDENYQIIQCNNKFAEFFNLKKEEIISKNFFDLMPQHFKEEVIKVLDSLFKERKDYTHYFTLKKDEKELYLKKELYPVIENNSVKYLISIVRDCTQEKQKEEELSKSKIQAEKNLHIKSRLIATISHEIRIPLNAINGFANLLLKQDLTESKKLDYISHINQNSYLLTRLIDDLIDISCIESGKFPIKKESVFIYPILEKLNEQFSYELAIRHKNNVKLILTNSLEDNIPFETDELRLRQIISNLLSNSIKYTISGEIKFGFSLMNNCIVFFVKDTGIGIKKEQIDNLLEPFYNLNKDNYKLDKSLGLGLYIVKNIVEQLDGTLHVDTEINKGTTFTIRFPFIQTLPTYSILPDDAKVSMSIDKEINILIAEDDDINYMFLTEMLSHEKIKIIRATNGLEVVELFKKHHCNLHIVLMDIQMPIIDGITATKLIKDINPYIPIIAQTAYAYSTEKDESLNAGCSDYIVKPIDINVLISKIIYYVNKE